MDTTVNCNISKGDNVWLCGADRISDVFSVIKLLLRRSALEGRQIGIAVAADGARRGEVGGGGGYSRKGAIREGSVQMELPFSPRTIPLERVVE